MAQTVCIILSPEDRARLAAVIQDRNSLQKHAQRAKIVLYSAERLPVLEVNPHRHFSSSFFAPLIETVSGNNAAASIYEKLEGR